MININNISFAYNKNMPVFTNFTQEIGGGLTYIRGTNGSGKSTLINLLMGILKPQSGDILIDGINVKNIKLHQMGRINGYLFQNPELMLFGNSVYDELAFPLRIEGISEQEIKDTIMPYLERFRISQKLNEHPLTLSYGEKQRLALATIFIREPARIILDEPTSRLDKESREELIVIMKEMLQSTKSIVIATHDEELINTLKGREIYIKRNED